MSGKAFGFPMTGEITSSDIDIVIAPHVPWTTKAAVANVTPALQSHLTCILPQARGSVGVLSHKRGQQSISVRADSMSAPLAPPWTAHRHQLRHVIPSNARDKLA